MRHLDLTEIARADLKSIRRYSQRTWGPDRTAQYMAALRDTMKGLLAGTVVSRNRDDLRPGLQMAAQMTPDSHDRFLARNRAVAPSYGVAPCVPRSFGQCG